MHVRISYGIKSITDCNIIYSTSNANAYTSLHPFRTSKCANYACSHMKLLDHFKCTCNWLRCEANRSTFWSNLRMRMFSRSYYVALVLLGFYYVDLVLFYATNANACIWMKMYHRISLSSFNREFIYMQFSEFTAS